MIDGESGDDTLSGDADVDDIFGGPGADTIAGGTEDDWIWSLNGPSGIDQPYNGMGPNPTWPDIKGMGQEDCDLEDGHPDMDAGCVHPTAVGDSYMVQAGMTLTVAAPGVLGNDTDPLGQPRTAILVQTTSNGTLSLASNGGFVYTPAFGFVGSDTFYYVAHAGSDSNVATVTITVFNQPPVAAGDSYGGYTGQTIGGNVLANDSFASGALYVTGSGPASGTLTLQTSGQFQYVPAAGFSGRVTFRYVATQSWTGFQSNQATVTIDILPFYPLTLDAPAADVPVSQVVDAGQVDTLYQEAVRRWNAAGVPQHVIQDRLYNVQFIITDLQGSTLSGATDDNRIVIDVNGAGYGWYLDSTPQDDGEFQFLVAPSERKAIGSSPAVARADLLTALTHEVGHLLGLEHSQREGGNSVMSPTLGLSTRRLPTLRDVAILELLDGWDRRRRR